MRRTWRSRDEAGAAGFRQLGFSVSFRVSSDLTEGTVKAMLEDFLYEVLAPNSLECGGGFSENRFQGFVTQWKASAGEGDRREVSEWLMRRSEVADFEVGQLAEAWYGV